MKTSKVLLLLACAVMGAGLYADDAKTPERPGKGFRKMGQRPDMVKILNLNDAEKKSMEEADAAMKEAAKKVREKALEEAKRLAAANWDAKLKVYKEAAARLTDAKEKARAEKMLERMEKGRGRLVERIANRILHGDRGKRPGFPGGPEGRHGKAPRAE